MRPSVRRAGTGRSRPSRIAVRRVDLLTVGEAFEDLIFFGLPRLPRPGEELKTSSFVRALGGGALTTAVAASRLGLRVGVLSGIGPTAEATLRGEEVSFTNLRRPEEPYALSVSLSTRRDRSFVTFNGINDDLEMRLPGSIDEAASRHVHFAFHPRRCRLWRQKVERLRRRGVTTSWDFGWNAGLTRDPEFPPLVAALDYLFVNEEEALLYARRRTLGAAVAHWRRDARETVIKLGRRGCRWVSAGRDVSASPFRVRVVDTTGAGDAFDGGFLYGVLRGLPPVGCLRVANAVGALSTRAPGGTASLPRLADLSSVIPGWHA